MIASRGILKYSKYTIQNCGLVSVMFRNLKTIILLHGPLSRIRT